MKGDIIMAVLIIKDGQRPTQETLKRLASLRDEDISYDDDCPKMTPKMQQALAKAVAKRNRLRKVQ